MAKSKTAEKAEKAEKARANTDLDSVIALLNKEYGSETIICGKPIVRVTAFPSHIATFDYTLGCGGIPLGRIGEIHGPESSGKTTLCLQLAAACQKHYFPSKERNGMVVYIDMEHAVDPSWATQLGVDFNLLKFSQPMHGEMALDIATKVAQTGQVDLIIIDSAAALTPKAVLDGDITDNHIAALARLLSKGLAQLKGAAAKGKTAVIFINQLRMKPGVMFGNPEDTPGGRALKFYADYRVSIHRGSQIKQDDEVVGFESHATFAKNKLNRPQMKCGLRLGLGHKLYPVVGVDKQFVLLSLASEHDIVTSKGNAISYDGQFLGSGMPKASGFLRENEEIYNKLRDEVYETLINPASLTDNFSVDDEIIGEDTEDAEFLRAGLDLEE